MNIFQGVRGTNYFKLLHLQEPLFIGVLPSNLVPVQAAFLHPFYNQLSPLYIRKLPFLPSQPYYGTFSQDINLSSSYAKERKGGEAAVGALLYAVPHLIHLLSVKI